MLHLTLASQICTPKDKLADWFEYYAGILELNVWTSTTLEESEWCDNTRQWAVKLMRDGKETKMLHPRHVILTTGHSGAPYLPSNIDGVGDFRGDRLVHSSFFTKTKDNAKGKKAAVIGCCNSGHDIARDYYDHGYEVTMLQRSSILIVTSETLIDVTMKGFYEEDESPVEDADIINMSIPYPVGKRLRIPASNGGPRQDSTKWTCYRRFCSQ